jgi:hypothetical protein
VGLRRSDRPRQDRQAQEESVQALPREVRTHSSLSRREHSLEVSEACGRHRSTWWATGDEGCCSRSQLPEQCGSDHSGSCHPFW